MRQCIGTVSPDSSLFAYVTIPNSPDAMHLLYYVSIRKVVFDSSLFFEEKYHFLWLIEHELEGNFFTLARCNVREVALWLLVFHVQVSRFKSFSSGQRIGTVDYFIYFSDVDEGNDIQGQLSTILMELSTLKREVQGTYI